MTYGQLDTRTNQLARYLQSLGAGQDTPVAVLMERSLDLIVAVMGKLMDFECALTRMEHLVPISGRIVLYIPGTCEWDFGDGYAGTHSFSSKCGPLMWVWL